jgi:hypothetical protein
MRKFNSEGRMLLYDTLSTTPGPLPQAVILVPRTIVDGNVPTLQLRKNETLWQALLLARTPAVFA